LTRWRAPDMFPRFTLRASITPWEIWRRRSTEAGKLSAKRCDYTDPWQLSRDSEARVHLPIGCANPFANGVACRGNSPPPRHDAPPGIKRPLKIPISLRRSFLRSSLAAYRVLRCRESDTAFEVLAWQQGVGLKTWTAAANDELVGDNSSRQPFAACPTVGIVFD